MILFKLNDNLTNRSLCPYPALSIVSDQHSQSFYEVKVKCKICCAFIDFFFLNQDFIVNALLYSEVCGQHKRAMATVSQVMST